MPSTWQLSVRIHQHSYSTVSSMSSQFSLVFRLRPQRRYTESLRVRKKTLVCNKLQIKNPQLKSLQNLNSEFFKKQLHPGKQYDVMLEGYTTSFSRSLLPQHLLLQSPNPQTATVQSYRYSNGHEIYLWKQAPTSSSEESCWR